MKEYRGCKYFELEEIKNGKPNNIGPSYKNIPCSLPHVQIWLYNKGEFIVSVDTGIDNKEIIEKNSEEFLEEVSKKAIDDILEYLDSQKTKTILEENKNLF